MGKAPVDRAVLERGRLIQVYSTVDRYPGAVARFQAPRPGNDTRGEEREPGEVCGGEREKTVLADLQRGVLQAAGVGQRRGRRLLQFARPR